jgi:hypothetical protein
VTAISNVGATRVQDQVGAVANYNERGDLGDVSPSGFERVWDRTVYVPPTRDQLTQLAEFWSESQQRLPKEGSDTFFSLVPTIGMRVQVRTPPNMTARVDLGHRLKDRTVSLPPDNPSTWEHRAAFLPMSAIAIQWKTRER